MPPHPDSKAHDIPRHSKLKKRKTHFTTLPLISYLCLKATSTLYKPAVKSSSPPGLCLQSSFHSSLLLDYSQTSPCSPLAPQRAGTAWLRSACMSYMIWCKELTARPLVLSGNAFSSARWGLRRAHAAPAACNEPMLIILKRCGANLGLTSQGLPLNPCQDLPQRNLCVLMRQ